MATTTRLSPADWLLAGLTALAQRGPGVLRAETLARDLGTTKGSFYWHFADVPAFHAQIQATWTEGVNTALAAQIEAATTPARALRDLARGLPKPNPKDPFRAAEPAMRGWAAWDAGAAQAVARADQTRLALISGLLDKIGVSNPDIARIVLAASTGVPRDSTGDPMGTLVDLVLALR